MRKSQLALMSYREIDAIDRNDALLLVPVGCVEQHGPAGYTGADTVFTDYVCRRTAEAVPQVFVAPPLWYGYTSYTAFPGTVSLRLETLRALIGDVIGGYVDHGFRHVVVVNNHGPNEAAIEPVATELRRTRGVTVGLLYPWRLAMHVAADLYPDTKAVFGHGGEPTISVMMALSPGTVTLPPAEPRGYVGSSDALRITSYRGARFQGFEVGVFSEAAHVLPNGASGDWTVATEARGREILERVVRYAIEFVPAFLRLSRERRGT